MNGLQSIPYTNSPKVYEGLAENVKDQIRAALENSFNKDANGQISKDATASIDGLYLIECLGDNHTFQELYKYKKGERIWKYFEGEYERINGCGSVVSPQHSLRNRCGMETRRDSSCLRWTLYCRLRLSKRCGILLWLSGYQ